MPSCKCHASALGFTGWEPFQEAANAGANGFDNIPEAGGIYCLRVAAVGEADLERIIDHYKKSSLYRSFRTMAEWSEPFFQKCGFGHGWGWRWYADWPDNDLENIRKLSVSSQKRVACPILYIGFGGSLRKRILNLMDWAHPFNHPLWALLYSKWAVELAVRPTADYKEEEKRVKQQYRAAHGGELPPFMKK